MNYELYREAVFDALCACLNLDKTSAAAAALIHEAYAELENVPRPPRNRNVIYWTMMQDPGSDPVSTAYIAEQGDGSARSANAEPQDRPRRSAPSGTHIPVICTTLKFQLIIVCYGPASEEYAHRIRSMLYLDGAGFPRRILRDAGIYPIPDPPQPTILHEEEGSLWRRRADLTISLRVRDEQRARARGSISTAPAVMIHR